MFEKVGEIFIHKQFEKPTQSFITDGISKDAFNPSKMRWFNTFEISQFIRFIVVLTWIKKYFDKLSREKQISNKRRYIADFGCSRSQLYGYWRSNCNYFGWPKISYSGVDADVNRLTIGRKLITPKKNDKFNHYLTDLTVPFKLRQKMDVITCLETIEHVPKDKVENVLKNIKKNLKRNGIAIISSPNPLKDKGETWVWNSPEDGGDHSYEWNFEEICQLLRKLNFEIIQYCGCSPRREFKTNTSLYKSLITPLTNNLPSSLVYSILCTVDDIELSKQWIVMVKKRIDK